MIGLPRLHRLALTAWRRTLTTTTDPYTRGKHVAEQFDSLSRLVCDLVERRMPGNAPQQPQNRPCEASSPRPDHRDTPSHSGPQNAETDL